jgi:hypothetical protein
MPIDQGVKHWPGGYRDRSMYDIIFTGLSKKLRESASV